MQNLENLSIDGQTLLILGVVIVVVLVGIGVLVRKLHTLRCLFNVLAAIVFLILMILAFTSAGSL
jgi:predicted membrane protein